MQASGKVDPDNMFITGGSHGGFLAAHLTGQFPVFNSNVLLLLVDHAAVINCALFFLETKICSI